MERHDRVSDFANLHWTLATERTFFVLGAGASYGLVPLTPQLRRGIRSRYLGCGIYPAERNPWTHLHERVIGRHPSYPPEVDIQEWDFRNMPIGALEFLVQRELYVPELNTIPNQYGIFNRFVPSTLFNFNLDGLASRFCRQHTVIEPHGRVDEAWLGEDDYETWLEATTVWDYRLPFIVPKLLPAPEWEGIIDSSPYVRARSKQVASSAVVLIGYSFGSYNGRRDDFATWHYLMELMRRHPKPVFVLAPEPEELADLIRQELSSFNVTGISTRWEVLATCLMSSSSLTRLTPPRFRDEVREFLYTYDFAVDHR